MKVLCNEAIIPIALDEELIGINLIEKKERTIANYKTPIHYFKTKFTWWGIRMQ